MSGYIYNNNIKFKSYGIFMVHYHRYSSRLFGPVKSCGAVASEVIINTDFGNSRRCIGRLGIRITRNCSFRYYRQSDYGDSRSILMLWIASLFNKRNVD